MKKIIFVFVVVALLFPTLNAQAAWYDWFWKSKKAAPIETTNSAVTEESKSASTDIELLKTEITTLQTNLDNLYKAHDGLVNDHNALLKYTNSLAAKYNISSNNSSEQKITNLENKVDDICYWAFGGLIRARGDILPMINCRYYSGTGSSLEGRISKLERGY